MFVRMLRKVQVSSDCFASVKTDLVNGESVTQNSLIKQNMNSDTFLYKGELNKKTQRQERKTCDLCDVFMNRYN